MEVQVKNKEEILELIAQYEEKESKLAKRRKWFAIAATVCILAVYLYLRLFNTAFIRDWDTGEIIVDYSTAWIVRIPSDINEDPKEGEVDRITRINNGYSIFRVKCPYAKILYIDDGIEEIGEPLNTWYPKGFDKSQLWAVRLPDTLSYVGYQAFYGCVNLKKIYWEQAPEDAVIGPWAFVGTGLEQIELPEGVSTISGLAFWNNVELKSVTLPQSLTQMNAGAFADCEMLTEVHLPNSLERLPDCAFSGCYSLQTINFPENIISIGKNAFWGTQIDKEQYPENLFFYSYATSLEDEHGYREYRDVGDGLYSTIESNVDVYDTELENVYLSEKTGIPVEVFAEPADSDRVWIEGQYYTFPMTLDDFLAKDNWSYTGEENIHRSEYTYEHADTGRTIDIVIEQEEAPTVRGITVSHVNDCQVVLPGGITNQGTHYYRVNEMFGLNNSRYYNPWWEYVAGSEEHPMKVSVSFVGEYDSRIDLVEIYAPKENP